MKRHSLLNTLSSVFMLRKVCSPCKGLLAICEHEHLVLKLCQGKQKRSHSSRKQKRQNYWRERNLHGLSTAKKRSIIIRS